ncbi:molybdenum cofactor guanylyltransferase [Microbacterium azadirachtae]|uniref:molybdenum cofactor guanylyltransferase n=1 Tax=Microbacterium azadirachtae TaxID=582680 RepID=UPI003F74BEF1
MRASAPAPGSASVAAVVLVGGRARRMGGAAKHLLPLGGSTPWHRTLAALADHGIAPIVAVGPAPDETAPGAGAKGAGAVTWVREEPPFGGPVAALAAALALPALARAEEFLLLAGDLAHPEAVVTRLIGLDPTPSASSLAADCGYEPRETAIRDQRAEGIMPEGVPEGAPEGAASEGEVTAPEGADGVVFRAEGRPQWLAGRYRVAAVRAALAALGEVEGASCRALLGGLPIRWIPDEDGTTTDIDTPDDLARALADADASADRSEEPS